MGIMPITDNLNIKVHGLIADGLSGFYTGSGFTSGSEGLTLIPNPNEAQAFNLESPALMRFHKAQWDTQVTDHGIILRLGIPYSTASRMDVNNSTFIGTMSYLLNYGLRIIADRYGEGAVLQTTINRPGETMGYLRDLENSAAIELRFFYRPGGINANTIS
jgi:hypothetical protein